MVEQRLQRPLLKGQHHRLCDDFFVQRESQPYCGYRFDHLYNSVNAHTEVEETDYALQFLVDFECDKTPVLINFVLGYLSGCVCFL